MYYFRADGSAKTGAGHLMRCLTVALELQKLTEHPEQVCFLCADEASAELLRSNHMPVKVLGTDPEDLEGELPVLERLTGDTKQINEENDMGKDNYKLVANNKKAYHDYFIDETYETGIALAGTEVKSVRMGKCSVKEAFVKVEKEEVWVYGMHISSYEKGNIFNKDPLRPRKLLMHKYEIRKIASKMAEKGYTMVPLKVYLKGSLVKVEVGLARGKKLYDKRQDIAKKDQRREAEKDFKVKNLY